MAADEPAGEAIDELMKPPVRRSKHGSRCLVHDAVYDAMSSLSRPTEADPERLRPGGGRDQPHRHYRVGTSTGQVGVTVEEIKEILIQATVYCATPAGRQAFLAVHEALGDGEDG
jgi:hypothetical protein